MRRVFSAGNTALTGLGVATAVLLAMRMQNARSPSRPLPVAAPQASVEFIRDSFTSGTRDGGLGPAN